MAARTVAPVKKTAVAKKTASGRPPTKRTVRVTKTIAPAQHAYIPDKNINYVGRQVWGVWDKILADKAMEMNRNILLMGDTGSGKTLFGEAYAAHKQMMYYSLPCDISIDPSSLFGRMQPTEVSGQYKWQDGPITQITRGRCGRGAECDDPTCTAGVLNVSEINFMTPKIAASLYPLLDHRRYIPLLGHEGEIVRAHHNLLIIADMNPNYRGTMELNDAFKNRFYYKIPWGYDPVVEEKLIQFPTMREIASLIRDMRGSDIETPLSTNMLMEFEQTSLEGELGLDFAINNFVSAFRTDEQQPVFKVFELNKVKIEKDMRYFVSQSRRKNTAVKDEELEDIEWEQEDES